MGDWGLVQLHIDMLELHERQFLHISDVVENDNLTLAVIKDQWLLGELNSAHLFLMRLLGIFIRIRVIHVITDLCRWKFRLEHAV
jgi:hypothetical protein